MATFTIEYVYDDRSDRRDAVRPEHRAYLSSLAACGRMHVYGRYDDEREPGALLVAEADDLSDVNGLVQGDPFLREGLVKEYRVRSWAPIWAQGRGPV